MLKFSSTLNLPLDAATQKIALLGTSGSGKSHAMTKLAEELLDNNVQVVILDPKGEAWGLRLNADGKRAGFPVPVFGGDQGDVPLRPEMGARVAELIVQNNYSAVLDLSEFVSSEIARFGYDFATKLFQLKKRQPGVLCLMVDEAQDFIPQNPQPAVKGRENYEPRMLHAFERLQKQGRRCGIGVVIAGQRPQEINKKVLNLTECWVTFQMTGLQERQTTIKIIGESDPDVAKAIEQQLPRLDVGKAYIWSPRWLKVSGVYHVLPKKTYDSSATPVVGANQVAPRQLSAIDIESLNKAMSAVVKQAQQDDPKHLKQRIAEMERTIKQAGGPPMQVDARALQKALAAQANELNEGFCQAVKQYEVMIADLKRRISKALETLQLTQEVRPPEVKASLFIGEHPRTEKGSRLSLPAARQNDLVKLRAGERVMLLVLAQFRSTVGNLTRDQLALLSGYTRSGTFDTYIATLIREGLAERTGQGQIGITSEGVGLLGDQAVSLPQTSNELIAAFNARLRAGERKMLEVLVEAYPQPVPRQQLAERSGYTRSGTFDTYVATLTRNLLAVKDRDGIRANDFLFLGDRHV